MKNYYQFCLVLLMAVLVRVRGNPIMVSFGTRMAPITAPTPRPRFPVTYPLVQPAPVYEDPEPENNSVYRVPYHFGFRVKPLVKSYLPLSYSKYYYSGGVIPKNKIIQQLNYGKTRCQWCNEGAPGN